MSLFDLFYRDEVGSSNPRIAASGTVNELESLTARLSAWLLVEHNEDGTHNVVPSGFAFVPIGAVMLWSTATAPSKWLICDGSQVSRTTYQGLFQIVGTTYGTGDGSTTFTLPDFRQKFPLGKAAAGTGATLGSTGGTIDHGHSLSGVSFSGSMSGTTNTQGLHDHGGHTGFDDTLPQLRSFTADLNSTPCEPHMHPISADGAHAHTVSGSVSGTTGAGTSGSANPPFLSINYIILAGI